MLIRLTTGLVGLLLLTILSERVVGEDAQAEPAWDDAIAEATRWAAARDELGKRLTECLTETSGGTRKRLPGAYLPPDLYKERQAVKIKLDCAAALGRLRYEPAIPKLIGMIDVRDPTAEYSDVTIERGLPCVGALAAYGNAAVPQLVRAYVSEATRSREDPLTHGRSGAIRMAIRVGGTEEVAATYARGLAVERAEKNVKRLLDALVASFRSR
jgi:hypothetical protein